MNINADTIELAEVTRGVPSASGYYRSVWFFGDDLVVKRDHSDHGACQAEYERYLTIHDFSFRRNGELFHVRFPETVMIGDYLVMKRVKHEFLKDAWSGECPDKPAGSDYCKRQIHREEHRSGILEEMIASELENRFGILDMHCENFMFDEKTNTFWIIDFAS